jgi:hypothetical protein
VIDDHELRVLPTQDADLPLRHGQALLLTAISGARLLPRLRHERERYWLFDHLADWEFAAVK